MRRRDTQELANEPPREVALSRVVHQVRVSPLPEVADGPGRLAIEVGVNGVGGALRGVWKCGVGETRSRR